MNTLHYVLITSVFTSFMLLSQMIYAYSKGGYGWLIYAATLILTVPCHWKYEEGDFPEELNFSVYRVYVFKRLAAIVALMMLSILIYNSGFVLFSIIPLVGIIFIDGDYPYWKEEPK